jgi:hypothetical protein
MNTDRFLERGRICFFIKRKTNIYFFTAILKTKCKESHCVTLLETYFPRKVVTADFTRGVEEGKCL